MPLARRFAYGLESPEVLGRATATAGAGAAAPYVVGGPALHVAHGNGGKGALSLLLRVGSPLVAALLGTAVRGGCAPCQRPRTPAGGASAESAVPSPAGGRRQLQFATPGGTRVIWVFDPEFNPYKDINVGGLVFFIFTLKKKIFFKIFNLFVILTYDIYVIVRTSWSIGEV